LNPHETVQDRTVQLFRHGTALHEAGHVVAGLLLGFRVGGAWIDSPQGIAQAWLLDQGGAAGGAAVEPCWDMCYRTGCHARKGVTRFLTVLMAGHATSVLAPEAEEGLTEAMFLADPDFPPGDTDAMLARDLLPILGVTHTRAGTARAAKEVRRLEEGHLYRARHRAVALVKEQADVIGALGAMLEQDGMLPPEKTTTTFLNRVSFGLIGGAARG
jgi:hypothetical protein